MFLQSKLFVPMISPQYMFFCACNVQEVFKIFCNVTLLTSGHVSNYSDEFRLLLIAVNTHAAIFSCDCDVVSVKCGVMQGSGCYGRSK